MFAQMGPLEVRCDAPPYAVVKACETLGFTSPLDVRWCRRGNLPHAGSRPAGMPTLYQWQLFFGIQRPSSGTCPCGQPLPALAEYSFSMASGRQVNYVLGQCGRCRTMVWDEA